MDTGIQVLRPEGLQRFLALNADAVNAVTERLYAAHGPIYEQFGQHGREACREDLAFHLEFLRPVLEFGQLQPMVDYLVWLGSVLSARAVPMQHVALSLDWLGEFFAGNMDAADGVAVTAALQAARARFLAAEIMSATPQRPDKSCPEAELFEAALLAGHQHQALTVANSYLDDGRGLVDLERNVIQPALYHIGEKWQANEVTVAQEHLATLIAQSVMTAQLLRSPPPPMIGKRVLLACVAGNDHALGLHMVSDAFQLAGWDVQYLGANTPARALIAQVIEWKPDLVGLSVSFPQQLRVAKEVIEELGKRLGDARPAVIIGGLAINRFIELARLVGADAYCPDPQAAIAYADRIVKG